MKPSEILRRAAQAVEENACRGGCRAITIAVGGRIRITATATQRRLAAPAMAYFQQVGPKNGDCGEFWWVEDDEWGFLNPSAPQARAARIVGLCLAAAIAESEGN